MNHPCPDWLPDYMGLGVFGPAYRAMNERDTHAPGSVDRVLFENAIKLCSQTRALLLHWLHGEDQAD